MRNHSITQKPEYNKKVDVWSLGVCGYEMISFDLPFTDELDVRDVNVSYKHLPINNHPSLVPLVHQMLIRDVASRPNASQMLEKINHLLHYYQIDKTCKLWYSGMDPISVTHLQTAASSPF